MCLFVVFFCNCRTMDTINVRETVRFQWTFKLAFVPNACMCYLYRGFCIYFHFELFELLLVACFGFVCRLSYCPFPDLLFRCSSWHAVLLLVTLFNWSGAKSLHFSTFCLSYAFVYVIFLSLSSFFIRSWLVFAL